MKKLHAVFVLTLLAATLGFSAVAAAAPVQLCYTKAETRGYNQVYGNDYGYEGKLVGFIEVDNLAYTKQVTVVYQVNGGGPWNETDAVWVKSLAGNKEIWKFETGYIENGASYQFAIRYRVNGQEYWDNNNGQDYQVAFSDQDPTKPGIVLGKNDLALQYQWIHGWTGAYNITFALRNLAYHKDVELVYSMDNWATTKTAKFSYRSTLPSGLELWTVAPQVGGYGYTPTMRYAVVYRVNGIEIWDNNFGDNYSMGN